MHKSRFVSTDSFSYLESQAKNVIRKAMKHIEKLTCIRFHAKEKSDDDYIEFIRAIG